MGSAHSRCAHEARWDGTRQTRRTLSGEALQFLLLGRVLWFPNIRPCCQARTYKSRIARRIRQASSPTVTVRFQVLYVLRFLSIERRRILHFAVTEHPTAAWAAQQVVEAFPWDTAPKYLLRDRDKVYGEWFRRRVNGIGIEEILIAPHSPWQNPYSERLDGSVRRECLDHVIVLSENHLRPILADYAAYYNTSRTHLSLEMDSPETRPVQTPNQGKVISLPQVGGLHHRYERRAA